MSFPVAALLGPRGVIALPGYFIADTPWAGTKSNNQWSTLTQGSTQLGGGRLATDVSASGDWFREDHYFATGTFKLALVYRKEPSQGIFTITGVSGTQSIDAYAALEVLNTYEEVTGIAVTAGLKTVDVLINTKNASSIAFSGGIQSMAWVRTGA